MHARLIDDQRTYRLATKLSAAARCATPTKYAMNNRPGIHFGTSCDSAGSSAKCSPANAAIDAATNTGPSATRPPPSRHPVARTSCQ